MNEIICNEMAFRNVLGFFPRYLRPPYGSCSIGSWCQDDVKKLGYHIVTWNVDLKDPAVDNLELIQNSAYIFQSQVSIDHSRNSYIIRAHDSRYDTAYELTCWMLARLRERTYRVVTVGECLGDPRQNWYFDTKNTGECWL